MPVLAAGMSATEAFARRGYDVVVNDTRLHLLDEGEGTPVLLLLGNPTWSYLWRDTIEPLVLAGHRVLVPDQRGFGGSQPMGSPYDDMLEVRVADLAGPLEVLGLDEVTLVLHDWGGPIGLAFAASHPQAVRALVLMSTWAWPDPSPFHTTVVPWRMLHAPLVGPHLLGRHNSLADRGVYLSVVDRMPCPGPSNAATAMPRRRMCCARSKSSSFVESAPGSSKTNGGRDTPGGICR